MSPNISEQTLANMVRDYWQQRGYKVDVVVRDCVASESAWKFRTYAAVRSNLVYGIPREYRGELGVKG